MKERKEESEDEDGRIKKGAVGGEKRGGSTFYTRATSKASSPELSGRPALFGTPCCNPHGLLSVASLLSIMPSSR
jgi:hypothetical protein